MALDQQPLVGMLNKLYYDRKVKRNMSLVCYRYFFCYLFVTLILEIPFKLIYHDFWVSFCMIINKRLVYSNSSIFSFLLSWRFSPVTSIQLLVCLEILRPIWNRTINMNTTIYQPFYQSYWHSHVWCLQSVHILEMILVRSLDFFKRIFQTRAKKLSFQ